MTSRVAVSMRRQIRGGRRVEGQGNDAQRRCYSACFPAAETEENAATAMEAFTIPISERGDRHVDR